MTGYRRLYLRRGAMFWQWVHLLIVFVYLHGMQISTYPRDMCKYMSRPERLQCSNSSSYLFNHAFLLAVCMNLGFVYIYVYVHLRMIRFQLSKQTNKKIMEKYTFCGKTWFSLKTETFNSLCVASLHFAKCKVFQRGKSDIDFNLEIFCFTKFPMNVTSCMEVSVMILYS